jgi:hypothetical protein
MRFPIRERPQLAPPPQEPNKSSASATQNRNAQPHSNNGPSHYCLRLHPLCSPHSLSEQPQRRCPRPTTFLSKRRAYVTASASTGCLARWQVVRLVPAVVEAVSAGIGPSRRSPTAGLCDAGDLTHEALPRGDSHRGSLAVVYTVPGVLQLSKKGVQ